MMIKQPFFPKRVQSLVSGASLMMLSSVALAHSGHSHAQLDPLSMMLHTLTTHPVMFSVIGTIATVAYLIRS